MGNKKIIKEGDRVITWDGKKGTVVSVALHTITVRTDSNDVELHGISCVTKLKRTKTGSKKKPINNGNSWNETIQEMNNPDSELAKSLRTIMALPVPDRIVPKPPPHIDDVSQAFHEFFSSLRVSMIRGGPNGAAPMYKAAQDKLREELTTMGLVDRIDWTPKD